MISPILLRLKEFCASSAIAAMLLVTLGLTSAAFGAHVTPSEGVTLWRDWMSVLERSEYDRPDATPYIRRDPSQTSGPRLYLMTDRVVEQTSESTAQFQTGDYRMVLADGATDDVDGDVDNYTDLFEDTNKFADRNDPVKIPKDDKGTRLPIDAIMIPLADGSWMGISDKALTAPTPAVIVSASPGAIVRATAAPASNFNRPAAFTNYSALGYYYFETSGSRYQYPLSLYQLRQDYHYPQDCNALESSIVPGVYKVEFSTIQNTPYGKMTASVDHRLVPDGTLTIGMKKPTWLLRSLTTSATVTSKPVAQPWVGGKLKFDPYLPLTLNWDNLYSAGLASPADNIDIWFEDDTGFRFSYAYRVSGAISTKAIDDLKSAAVNWYGDVKSFVGQSASGHIVMQYKRYANGQATADLSTVTLQIPVEMYVSYASWRKAWWPSLAENDPRSDPGADFDGDGYTNQQEYDLGYDPTTKAIGIAVFTPTLTSTTATIGGNLTLDPLVTDGSTAVYESGVVYSATNQTPQIDGPDVTQVISVDMYHPTADLTDLQEGTQYWYQAYVIYGDGTVLYSSPVATFTTPRPPPITLPTMGATTLTGVTGSSATLGSSVVSDGGSSLLTYGVVYAPTAVNPNPHLGDFGAVNLVPISVTADGFIGTANGLAEGTSYSFNAYATNSLGTTYTTPVVTFTTLTRPTVTSSGATNITATSVTLGGNVTSTGGAALSARGVVYSLTNANPTTADSLKLAAGTSTGAFTVNVASLKAGKLYYYRAYATNIVGTAYSTPTATFTTALTLPTVTLNSPASTDLTGTTVTLGGNVTLDGGTAITQRGVVYSIYADPVLGLADSVIAAPPPTTGAFTVPVTGLTPGTTYYFKAYAKNSLGTSYSAFASFKTQAAPTVTTPLSAGITSVVAWLSGNVTSDGGLAITERGVVYSITAINANPLIGGTGVTKVTSAGTTGQFWVSTLALPLPGGTAYSFKAYATNASGTIYTTPVATFTTLIPPTVMTPTSVGITMTTATLGGDVTLGGDTAITERGVVCSATNGDPLIGGVGVTQLTATGTTGVFTVNFTGLTAATSYSFKAYAINSGGTTYTTPVATFTTLTPPVLTTPTIADLIGTTVTLGATVADSGTALAITESGVVFSISSRNSNPLVGGTDVIQWTGGGTAIGLPFSFNATGLQTNTGYSFKAYAISSVGTGYSPVVTFTTATTPTLNSPTVASLTARSALVGGTVTSDGRAPITERGVIYYLPGNSSPWIGGSGVSQKTVTGTVGLFTVTITGLTPTTQYYFKGYATNSAGTTYSSPYAFFTTLPATTLLGASSMQWVPVPTRNTSKVAFQTTATNQAANVPVFAYTKTIDEQFDTSLNLTIEVSTDAVSWVDASAPTAGWLVDLSSPTITAQWNPTTSPPARAFFRVSRAPASSSAQ